MFSAGAHASMRGKVSGACYRQGLTWPVLCCVSCVYGKLVCMCATLLRWKLLKRCYPVSPPASSISPAKRQLDRKQQNIDHECVVEALYWQSQGQEALARRPSFLEPLTTGVDPKDITESVLTKLGFIKQGGQLTRKGREALEKRERKLTAAAERGAAGAAPGTATQTAAIAGAGAAAPGSSASALVPAAGAAAAAVASTSSAAVAAAAGGGGLGIKACAWCKQGDVKLKVCTGCSSAWYCSSSCQASDWPTHKKACRATKQARK